MSPGCRLEPYNSASLNGLMSIDVSWLQVNGADTNSVNPVTVFLKRFKGETSQNPYGRKEQIHRKSPLCRITSTFLLWNCQSSIRMAGSAHLRDISRTSGLTFKGIL